MSQKTVISVGLSGSPAFSDLDEDLDLTDTKLLSSDDEELKKYIDIPSNKESVTSSDGDYIESFRFIPLTSSSLVTAVVTTKDAPVVVLSDTDDDLTEIELNSKSLVPSDPPDYESPVEDENQDVKPPLLDRPEKEDSDDLAYDELLEMCGQDVGDMDNSMDTDNNIHDDDDYEDDDDDDHFHRSATTKVKVKNHLKRVSPYRVKDRILPVKGKGKQPVSGACRFKSTQKKSSSPVADGTDQELVFRDSARPICYGDGPIDINVQVKEEEKPIVPPPPMVCESCEKEEGHNNVVQCCDGHIVCMRCVEVSTKKILVGEKKGSVECPGKDCTSSVPLSELRKALPAIVLDLLEDKWKKETLEALENMKDAVKCPGCNFSAVLDMSMKRFQCVQCKEAYCRYCDKKWTERKTHDLCIRTKQWTSTVTGNVVNIPAQWSDGDTADTDCIDGKSESHTLVELDSTSAEFYDVVHFMNKHMKSTVKKIFRIQNERLWEKYSLTRSHMVADLGELNINEKRLFHGTHADVIEAICKEGFDWRLCGKHGTVYGQGTYFAKSPVISHRYSSGNLSRRGRNINSGGSGLFAMFFGNSGRQASQYKPPLRFGAPITTSQSTGFTFGATTTTQSSGFTFGASRSSQPSSSFAFGSPASAYHQGFNLGAAPTTTNSSFAFGSASTSNASTGIALAASTNNPNTGFRFGSSGANLNQGSGSNVGLFGAASTVKKHKLLPHSRNDNDYISLPDPTCLHSQQKQSTVSSTTGDSSCSGSKKSSNCIFCSPKRKAGDSGPSTTAVAAVLTGATPAPAVSGTGSTNSGSGGAMTVNDFRQHLLKSQKQMIEQQKAALNSMFQGNTGAHLFVRAIPPTSASGFTGSGSGGSGTSGFSFGTGFSNSNAGGSSNGSRGNSAGNVGGFHFGVDSDKTSDNDHFMFLARVLVGRSCMGTHEMRRPAKDREGRDTHSAVEREHKPSIFVIFDNNQCYPEYIIQYTTSSVG
ncbi:uncharacterized protein LOC128550319 isoform X3 [Mercenaria mercenaria]|uniref:uncharacterized protein LOC128550319 isoform X3 n=1 Tax=Mercenaria mercenaria TaxID=6596 RepID=UPI00234FB01C|nr:uncharacterized protein LOC128550319 isoform X3 [Mercenaria mercenaria]